MVDGIVRIELTTNYTKRSDLFVRTGLLLMSKLKNCIYIKEKLYRNCGIGIRGAALYDDSSGAEDLRDLGWNRV